jgi:hypothetical protein
MGEAREGGSADGTRLMGFAPGAAEPALTVLAPPELLALAPLFLFGWEAKRASDGSEPAVTCRAQGDGYEIRAAVLPGGLYRARGAFEAADVIASALAALALCGRATILPHAAALQSPAGLVLLLADTTGGKSTLALTLAAAGWRLFSDDRLGLRRDMGASIGIAPGLAPKLRLPLPSSADPLSAFLSTRTARRWPSHAYLALRSDEQAPPGARAPVAACLLLDRRATAPALEPVHPARLVRALAESAAAPWLAPAEAMAAAAAHADLPAFHLRYGEAADAARLLQARFGGGG